MVSAIAALKAGSLTVSVFDWSSTISACSSIVSPFASTVKPASSMIRSAVRDSPTLASLSSMYVVPAWMLKKTDATTNASQPKTAVFQWLALQWPMRAARPFGR